MVKETLRVENTLGLHARPAALFVKTAGKFRADVFLTKGDIEVNGKSIMGVMMLAAEKGSWITIRAEGEDEEEALAQLVELVKGKFNEE